MRVADYFLNYVKINTQSDPNSKTYPSTSSQLEFGKLLQKQLQDLGFSVSSDNFGYVISRIPASVSSQVPSVALIAHMDTSPDASGDQIKPRIVYDYDGKDIILNAEKGILLSPQVFPNLLANVGHDLIVTDGQTLLGADDKAGVAEIMALAEFISENPTYPHGDIILVFTPDEEVGNGTLYLDPSQLSADFGYTLDGEAAGEISFENFNAAEATVTIIGASVHPGSAKNKMVNAISLAYEFDQYLPRFARPEITEKYEGFNHLYNIEGRVEKTTLSYIIRNHDPLLFEKQKTDFLSASAFLNRKYGKNTCDLVITDSYYNMKEKLEDHQEVIDIAIDAITEIGLAPIIEPIRGGTDGARLTYQGLPCPNLGTGGHNYHGPFEYASIQEMEQSLEILKIIIRKIARQ
jgi:tripeptide aminopeptidase